MQNNFYKAFMQAAKDGTVQDFYKKHRFRFFLRDVLAVLRFFLSAAVYIVMIAFVLFSMCITAVVLIHCIEKLVSPIKLLQLLGSAIRQA